MEVDVEVPAGEGSVVVRPAENVSRQLAGEFRELALQAAVKCGRDSALIDLCGRGATSTLLDKYEFAYRDARRLQLNALRRVALCSETPNRIDLDFWKR